GKEGILERLQYAEELIIQGKYEEALELANLLERDDLADEDRLAVTLLKSRLFIQTDRPKRGLKLAEQIFEESQRIRIPSIMIDALISMATALLRLDRLKECLDAIKSSENHLSAIHDNQFSFVERESTLKYLKGKVYRRKGELDLALRLLQDSLYVREEIGNSLLIADFLNEIGVIYASKGQFNLAMEHLQQSLAIFEELRSKPNIIKVRNNIGMVYWQIGKLDQALESYYKCQILSEELGNKRFAATLLLNIGLISYYKGELYSALDFYQQALTKFAELDSKSEMATCYNNIAEIHVTRGDLDLALEFHRNGLAIAKEIGKKQEIASSLANIGLVYEYKADFEAASNYFSKSLKLYDQIGNSFDTCQILTNLIRIAVLEGSLETARFFLKSLESIDQKEENPLISQTYRLSKAIILKTSRKMINRAEAQQLLQQIVEEEVKKHSVTIIAMLHLCELFLDEVRSYGNTDAFQGAKTIIQRIYPLAQAQHSFSLIIEVLILQAKLALVDGNLIVAARFLDQARVTAEEKGLDLLAAKVLAERQNLEDQYDTWQEFIQSNAPFQARLEQARLTKYLKNALKIANMPSGY
ncbi:MAG: tetratricopeptide repeat protein, partial [Candidatus Hodarchaeota archaeon]